jgi:hypothetical protein
MTTRPCLIRQTRKKELPHGVAMLALVFTFRVGA